MAGTYWEALLQSMGMFGTPVLSVPIPGTRLGTGNWGEWDMVVCPRRAQNSCGDVRGYARHCTFGLALTGQHGLQTVLAAQALFPSLTVPALRDYADVLISLSYHTSWVIFKREIPFQAPGEDRATQPLHRRPRLLFWRDGSSFSQTPPWLGSKVAAPCSLSQAIAPLPPTKLFPPCPSGAPKVSSHGCRPEIVPTWLSLHLSPRKGSI